MNADEAQEFARTLGPWLAAIAAALTLMGTVVRLRSADRIRGTIRRDLELHSGMPDGEAKETIEALLAVETRLLADRVQHGRQFSGPQLMIIAGAGFVVFTSLWAAIQYAQDRGWLDADDGRFDGWLQTPYDVAMAAIRILGIGLIATGVSFLCAGWLLRKLQLVQPDWRAHVDRFLWVLWVTRWIVPQEDDRRAVASRRNATELTTPSATD
jgi:hypothetical protein